jgi:hypothetical protein
MRHLKPVRLDEISVGHAKKANAGKDNKHRRVPGGLMPATQEIEN